MPPLASMTSRTTTTTSSSSMVLLLIIIMVRSSTGGTIAAAVTTSNPSPTTMTTTMTRDSYLSSSSSSYASVPHNSNNMKSMNKKPLFRLEYDLWSSPILFSPSRTATEAMEYWSGLETVAAVLYPHGAHLVPHAGILQDGVQSHCHVARKITDHDDDDDDDDDDDNDNDNHDGNHDHDSNHEPCGNLCTHGGRYCAADPDGNLHVGLSGQDLVTESLRRLCIWQVLQQEHEQHEQQEHTARGKSTSISTTFPYAKWFAYLAEFQRHCYADTLQDATQFRNTTCLHQVYDTVGINAVQVEEICMQEENHLYLHDYDHDNHHDSHHQDHRHHDLPSPLLERELEILAERGGIYMIPTFQINPASGTMEDEPDDSHDNDEQEHEHEHHSHHSSKNPPEDHHDSDPDDPPQPNYYSLFGSDASPPKIFVELCGMYQRQHDQQEHQHEHRHGHDHDHSLLSSVAQEQMQDDAAAAAAEGEAPVFEIPHVCQACQVCPHVLHCLRSNGYSCLATGEQGSPHDAKDDANATASWFHAMLSSRVFYCAILSVLIVTLLGEKVQNPPPYRYPSTSTLWQSSSSYQQWQERLDDSLQTLLFSSSSPREPQENDFDHPLLPMDNRTSQQEEAVTNNTSNTVEEPAFYAHSSSSSSSSNHRNPTTGVTFHPPPVDEEQFDPSPPPPSYAFAHQQQEQQQQRQGQEQEHSQDDHHHPDSFHGMA